MPIAKGRDRRRGRRAKLAPRDPSSTEAYEHGWYALLVRQADGHDPVPEEGPEPEDAVEEDTRQLATVTELVRPEEEPGSTPEPPAAPIEPAVDPDGTSPAPRPSALERASMRIGVRRLEDPESVYLRYLTSSTHRDFFRTELWPASRSITPVHLWRANHVGAAWDTEQVDRFMDVAATLADELLAIAPGAAPPGRPERRAWMVRFLSAEWVREFGIARISKTLFPVLPELVPDLDPTLTSWARARWLGVPEPDGVDEAERCLETWELLEDVLVLRTLHLGRIVRRLHRLVPTRAPIGSLGLVLAAFWDDLWTETDPLEASRRGGRRSARRRARGAGDAATATADDPSPEERSGTAAAAARSARRPASAARRRGRASGDARP